MQPETRTETFDLTPPTEQQFDAQEERKGIWAGEFQMPWDWRAPRCAAEEM